MVGLKHAAGLCLALSLIAFVAGADAASLQPQEVRITDAELGSSLTGAPGDPVQGAKWFKSRKLGNCLACHGNKDLASEPFHGEIGPPLDGVADRYSEAELRAIVVNSKDVFGPETIMPGFYRVLEGQRVLKDFQGKPILTAEQVEDVIAYLNTLKE
ncbi:sulfur oxidation c-type cytochrome SoxX [Pelagibius litoralis]|uniref:Sulfur oxidation c-type cytochrome SoxX n=1 Tax=Pelagibius litoralis TaxID=374515 RepID=A0A967K7A9_9PROT|nr:sulfur oxidation c-type cytochrome SoxX [Pelagibius litoralis]NIA69733.1 sulfur oxidation c-type cytochrome SoxX [Pelagibius litoralis]